jgi:hypothetical protein
MDAVISHTPFNRFRKRIASPALRAIADHWSAAKSDRRMPSWSDLSPSVLAPYLTSIWAFKYDAASKEFTARLAGNRIMVGFGQSFRGTPLRDLHPPHIFEECHANLTRLVLGPAVYYGHGKLFKAGDQIVSGERIVLPLASDGRNGDGALGAADYDYRPVTAKPIEIIHDQFEWFAI